jgi:hypothetical protein
MCLLSRNLGASTSWNPKGLSRPVMGLLYLITFKQGAPKKIDVEEKRRDLWDTC